MITRKRKVAIEYAYDDDSMYYFATADDGLKSVIYLI